MKSNDSPHLPAALYLPGREGTWLQVSPEGSRLPEEPGHWWSSPPISPDKGFGSEHPGMGLSLSLQRPSCFSFQSGPKFSISLFLKDKGEDQTGIDRPEAGSQSLCLERGAPLASVTPTPPECCHGSAQQLLGGQQHKLNPVIPSLVPGKSKRVQLAGRAGRKALILIARQSQKHLLSCWRWSKEWLYFGVVGGRGTGQGEHKCPALLPMGSPRGCSLTLPSRSFKGSLRPSFTPFQRSY